MTTPSFSASASTTPFPPTLSCPGGSGDSPLSTTASILSILTFALGLLASYIALQSATRGAPLEIARLVDDLRTTQHEINRVAEYIFDDAHRHVVALREVAVAARFVGGVGRPAYDIDIGGPGEGNAGAEGGGGSSRRGEELYVETQTLLGNCVRLFYEADNLLKRSREDAARWDLEGLRRRVVFVMNRHEVAEKIQRLGDQKAKLAAVQMSLFIRKSAVQDRMLGDVLAMVKDLQGMKRESESDDSGVIVSEGGD